MNLRCAPERFFLIPAILICAVAFLWPMTSVFLRSFTEPQIGLQNYIGIFHNAGEIQVLLRTLWMAFFVATVTLVVAYPYAYLMTVVGPRTRVLLAIIALLPFWMSLMARTFAWVIILGKDGVFSSFLQLLGFEPAVLLGTFAGVTIGTVQVLLPYMVLTLYSTFVSIDRRLLDAATSLGARPLVAFLKVYWPLSLPGSFGGFFLVFAIALGFYVTPRILGSPQQSMVAQIIDTLVERLLDFGGAGALGMVLLVVTIALTLVAARLLKTTDSVQQRSES